MILDEMAGNIRKGTRTTHSSFFFALLLAIPLITCCCCNRWLKGFCCPLLFNRMFTTKTGCCCCCLEVCRPLSRAPIVSIAGGGSSVFHVLFPSSSSTSLHPSHRILSLSASFPPQSSSTIDTDLLPAISPSSSSPSISCFFSPVSSLFVFCWCSANIQFFCRSIPDRVTWLYAILSLLYLLFHSLFSIFFFSLSRENTRRRRVNVAATGSAKWPPYRTTAARVIVTDGSCDVLKIFFYFYTSEGGQDGSAIFCLPALRFVSFCLTCRDSFADWNWQRIQMMKTADEGWRRKANR